MNIPVGRDRVFVHKLFDCMFPGNRVPCCSWSSYSFKERFSPGPVLVHGYIFHKIILVGPNEVSINFTCLLTSLSDIGILRCFPSVLAFVCCQENMFVLDP